MSVYRPKDRNGKEAAFYKFDFQHAGRRYSGSTGATTEREALRVEKAERAKATEEAKLVRQANGALWTWGRASLTYFREVLNNDLDATAKSGRSGWRTTSDFTHQFATSIQLLCRSS